MQRTMFVSTVILFFTLALSVAANADGLVNKLPPVGHWASFDVTTTIDHEDGTQSRTKGTLIVRALGQVEVDGKNCRWLEFELTWEQLHPESANPFHSSINKVVVDESAFEENNVPFDGILSGICAKESRDQRPEKWTYHRPRVVRPGVGSSSGYGVIDYYLRFPDKQKTELDSESFQVGDETIECPGIEVIETTHTFGVNRNSVRSIAYRQWTCEKAPFGVAKYQFERLEFRGRSFRQELVLKDMGKNAESSLPDSALE